MARWINWLPFGLTFAVLATATATTAPQTTQSSAVPVFGIVRDQGGGPVAGARVHAVQSALPGLPRSVSGKLGIGVVQTDFTETDEHGKFVLRVRSAGIFGVVASLGETARSEVVAPASPASHYELTLYPVQTVAGKIVTHIDGEEHPPQARQVCSLGPVRSGVTARPWPHREFGFIEQVESDTEGRFELRVLVGTECSIATLPDFSSQVNVTLIGEADANPLVLRRDLRSITCAVMDAGTEQPLANARLHGTTEDSTTDANGLAEATVPVGSSVSVDAQGHEPYYLGEPHPGPSATRLTSAPPVQFRLVDGRGQPLRDIQLCVARIAQGESGSGPLVLQATTDGDGQVSLARARRWGLVVWANIDKRFVRIVDIPKGGEPVDLGDVSTATAEVRGSILDEDGVPAAHLPIFAGPVESAFGSRWPLEQHPIAYTDHAGKFVVSALVKRPHNLAVRSLTSLVAFAPEFTPGQTEAIQLRLVRAPVIAGQVVNADGSGLPGLRVSCSATQDGDPRLMQYGLWSSYATSDANGRFEVSAVIPDRQHQLRAFGVNGLSDSTSTVEATPPADDVQLVVPDR